MPLTPLDFILIGIILYGAYVGAIKGVFKSISTIVAIMLSVALGAHYRIVGENVLRTVAGQYLNQSLLMILGFVVAFVVVFWVTSAILGRLRECFKALLGGDHLDKALGALLGGGAATLLLSIALVVLGAAGLPGAQSTQGSVVYPLVRDAGRQGLGLLPQFMGLLNQQMKKLAPAPPGKDPRGPETPPQDPAKPRNVR